MCPVKGVLYCIVTQIPKRKLSVFPLLFLSLIKMWENNSEDLVLSSAQESLLWQMLGSPGKKAPHGSIHTWAIFFLVPERLLF